MNWIDKLERRYGNLGIPNLINCLLYTSSQVNVTAQNAHGDL